MALILISRGSFSGGQLISQCLSQSAGWRCLTREDLIASVNTHGELASKVTASIQNAAQDYGKFSALRRPYKILTQLALLEYVLQGDVAYFGYSGHLLLPGISHAIRVRIIAPVALRVRLLMEREKLTEEQARERIRLVDEERSRWTRFMYGKNLRDPELFDLCLNLERISFSSVCSILVNAAEQNEFKPTPESVAAVRNRYLSVRVLAALVTNPKTSELEIAATAEEGRIALQGPYLDVADRSFVLSVAGAVPGVNAVQYAEGYTTPFDILS